MENSELLLRLSEQLPEFDRFRKDIQNSGLSAWLVGGCVRDLLLERQIADVDLVSTDNPTDWARTWSRKMGGHWFWLDEKRRQSRVLLDSGLSFDFSPLRAATIVDDLTLRDFTINALALPVVGPGAGDLILLDPLNGLQDLHHRLVRSCTDHSLMDDPLRMLKGIRHAVCLDFSLCPTTISAIQHHAQRLEQVAGERIRDELLLILASENLITAIHLLTESQLFPVLFGGAAATWEPSQVGHDMVHIANRIRQFEKSMSAVKNLNLAQMTPLILLASLLNHYQLPDLPQVLKRLKLSRTAQRMVVALQETPDQVILQDIAGVNDVRRLALAVEQLHPFGQERLFFWGWCNNNLPEDQVVNMLTAYGQLQQRDRVADLLSGNEFRSIPQKQIGSLQKAIKRAEIKGLITNIEQAKEWLKRELSFDKNG